jgi:hypothetical protein
MRKKRRGETRIHRQIRKTAEPTENFSVRSVVWWWFWGKTEDCFLVLFMINKNLLNGEMKNVEPAEWNG